MKNLQRLALMKVNKKLPHSCFDKAREIRRRVGILLGLDSHDVISELCREWGCNNADDFYRFMNRIGDNELKAYVENAIRNARRKKLIKETPEEIMAIA